MGSGYPYCYILSSMTVLTLLKEHFCFGGQVAFYRHASEVCRCDMNFSVFVPPQAQTKPVPILYYLSGLTCTDENFITKAGAQPSLPTRDIFKELLEKQLDI